uniref:ATP synthase F0 subunit b n=1 Tax=Bidens parviflora TaxID=1527830 RepID=UPI001FF43174|nr:ATP synthase F0 subunit b [Bidens parviflora]UIR98964.1 ATP synthase F0 subunit b [Bidens parviflora]
MRLSSTNMQARKMLFAAILSICASSSKKISIYNEEMIVARCFIGFIIFSRKSLGKTFKVTLDGRIQAIQEESQQFLNPNEVVPPESNEQQRLLRISLRICGTVVESLPMARSAPKCEKTVQALLCLLAFFLLASLVLSCHTGTGNYVFMDDLSRAVQQFYPGSGSSGAFSNPTPPPGNSGGVYIVPITQQQEGERPAETPQLYIVSVVSQLLLEYRNKPEVIKEFPWLINKNHGTLVKDFFRENLDIETKTETEILDLTKFLLNKKQHEPLFKAHFDHISPEEISNVGSEADGFEDPLVKGKGVT